MHKDDAIRIMARLTAAFPQVALEEEQAEVLVNELALLHDPRMLDISVTQIIQRDERFPSIARIRSAYRTNNELASLSRSALERADPAAKNGIPEWVHVWEWQRRQTLEARQEANEKMGGDVKDRVPVRMRDFPQLPEPLGPDAYTWDEYGVMREAWVADGAHEFGAAEILQGMA